MCKEANFNADALIPNPDLTQALARYLHQSLKSVPLNYRDSANWLWKSESTLFKLARLEVQNHPFWVTIEQLWQWNRIANAAEIQKFRELFPLELRSFFRTSEFLGLWQSAPLWKQNWIEEEFIQTALPYCELGQIWQKIHQFHHHSIGSMFMPSVPAIQWWDHVESWISQSRDISDKDLWYRAYRSAKEIPPIAIVPTLIDWRLDQFIYTQSQNWVCLDYEALVWAPIELNWIIWEKILTPAHWNAFQKGYAQLIPNLSLRKDYAFYNLLIHQLQLLGPTSNL